jgi:Flp pilus assembly pilin Flp
MKRFFRSEQGQGMTEYALILGGVAALAIAVVAVMSPGISTAFGTMLDTIIAHIHA